MVGKPTLAAAPASNGIKFTFAPADPDAAITYRFVLKKSGVANVTKDVAFDSKDLQKNAGNLEYTWAAAPSGSLTGIVRWAQLNGQGKARGPIKPTLPGACISRWLPRWHTVPNCPNQAPHPAAQEHQWCG